MRSTSRCACWPGVSMDFQGDEVPVEKDEKCTGNANEEMTHHCQVVISASRGLCDGNREQLLEKVVAELQETFPKAKTARLIRSRMVTDPCGLSVRPGIDTVRPSARTSIKNLFLQEIGPRPVGLRRWRELSVAVDEPRQCSFGQ